jgi:hypothetical protein
MALVKCPECGKDVSTNAAACPHCGCPVAKSTQRVTFNQSVSYYRALQLGHNASTPSSSAPPTQQGQSGAVGRKKPSEIIGMILVMLPVVAGILTWFWIGNMRLIDGPGATLGGLSALTVLFTAALAAFEASELGFGKDKTRSRQERVSPLEWFFSMVLLWIGEYPIYLYARSRYGVRNLVGFGLLSMILWLVPLCIVSYHIITAESNMRQILQSRPADLPSKAHWQRKFHGQYANFGRGQPVSVAQLKRAVGEPSSTQSVGAEAYWYYQCSDGSVQVVVDNPNVFGNGAYVKQVNDY